VSLFAGKEEAVLRDCRLRVGGWPYHGVVYEAGEHVYLVDSIPVALPAAVRAIGVLSGQVEEQKAEEPGTLSAEIDEITARLTRAQYSAGQLEDFRDLLRLAQYHNFQANFPQAEAAYRKALELQEGVLPGEPGGHAFLLMHIALELSNQDRYDEADQLFKEAKEALSASFQEETDEPRLLSYLAIHSANQGEDARAIELAQQATQKRDEIARKYAPGVDATVPRTGPRQASMPSADPRPTTGDIGVVRSRAEAAFGDMVQSRAIEAAMLVRGDVNAEAEVTLREAVNVMEREPRVPGRWEPQILVLQAQLDEEKRDYAAAKAKLERAIAQQRALFTTSRFEGLTYLALGRVLAKQDRPDEALQAYDAGFAILGREGEGLLVDEVLPYLATAFAETRRMPARREELERRMFEVAQMVRGPVAAQTMAQTLARLAQQDKGTGKLIHDLQVARQQRYQMSEAMYRAYADPYTLAPELDQVRKDWEDINAQVASLEVAVQRAEPRYNQLVDKPVSAEDVRRTLKPGEALAQILVGKNGSIGFLITLTTLDVYRIRLGSEQIASYVNNIRSGMTKDKAESVGDAAEQNYAALVGDGLKLYQELFAPIEVQLKSVQHLVTVPRDSLLALPFGVLVTDSPPAPSGGSPDWAAVPWMARRHAISFAPSVQSFVNLRQQVQLSQASRLFVGFGGFVPHRDPDAVLDLLDLPKACRDEVSKVASAAELPRTASEVNRIASAFNVPPGQVFVGPEFTDIQVKQLDLTDYHVVFFATHGLLPHSLGCLPEPALLTNRFAGNSQGSDGLLTASEIANLRLDADLVVLSACNTGGPGLKTGGESLSGLARAFFFAGSRSLLVSHWPIGDQPTADLMIKTLTSVARQGLAPAEALKLSQASLLDQSRWSHPRYWGAFSLVGDGGRSLGAPAIASQ
jgi:CHAT domain-containing protein